MLLSFTALDEKAQWREFSCEMIGLEDVFDFLNVIAKEGHTIVQAYVHEDGIRTELPGEAFDGKSITAPIRKLEKQWKQALKKPLRPANDSELIRQEITHQRIKVCDRRIAVYELSLHHFVVLYERAIELPLSPDPKERLIHHYERNIVSYQQLIEKSMNERYALQRKLKQLTA